MASLNEIVASLSARMDKPFSPQYQDEIKHLIGVKRSHYMQRLLNKYPDRERFFWQEGNVPFEEVSDDLCASPTGGMQLRSSCNVPKPIHYGRDEFAYVGNINGRDPFQRWVSDYADAVACSPYTSNRPKWYYADNRLYIINYPEPFTELRIRAVFDQPEQINQCTICDPACYSDDDEYPIAQDLLNIIIQEVLANDLSTGAPIEKEEVTPDEQQNR